MGHKQTFRPSLLRICSAPESGRQVCRQGATPNSVRSAVPRSIGCEKVADAEQWRRRCTIRASARFYSLSGRPVMGHRAFGNGRLASPGTGTGPLWFSLHSVGWIACPRAWGCPSILAGGPPPGAWFTSPTMALSALTITCLTVIDCWPAPLCRSSPFCQHSERRLRLISHLQVTRATSSRRSNGFGR